MQHTKAHYRDDTSNIYTVNHRTIMTICACFGIGFGSINLIYTQYYNKIIWMYTNTKCFCVWMRVICSVIPLHIILIWFFDIYFICFHFYSDSLLLLLLLLLLWACCSFIIMAIWLRILLVLFFGQMMIITKHKWQVLYLVAVVVFFSLLLFVDDSCD